MTVVWLAIVETVFLCSIFVLIRREIGLVRADVLRVVSELHHASRAAPTARESHAERAAPAMHYRTAPPRDVAILTAPEAKPAQPKKSFATPFGKMTGLTPEDEAALEEGLRFNEKHSTK